MNCTGAYREALTRDFSSRASSAPPSTSAPSQRRTNPGQDDPDSRGVAAAGAVAESGPAMALAQDATVVNGEVIDQR
jgi:hypothetical protein